MFLNIFINVMQKGWHKLRPKYQKVQLHQGWPMENHTDEIIITQKHTQTQDNNDDS